MGPMAPRSTRPFCSEISADSGEPLAGTASRVDSWILLEYRGVWGSNAFAGSGLSDQVKSALRRQLAALHPAKLLFIRRRERRGREGATVFFARSAPAAEVVTRFDLARYEDLLELDFTAPEPPGTPTAHPLFLVCTHGKHDRCCALHGRPLYDVLLDQAGEDWIWQASHVGGDRFAGNVVVLPEGLYYGRVEPEEAWTLLDEHLAGRIYLERFRGRSTQPFPVQAAEIALRLRDGLRGVGEVTVESARALGGDRWEAVLRGPDRRRHELAIVVEEGPLTYLTCESEVLRRPPRYAVGSLRESAA